MNSDDDYQQQGYIVLRNFFTAAEIAEFRRCVDRVFPSWYDANQQAIFEQRMVNMHSLTHADYLAGQPDHRLEFFNAIASEKLCNAMADLFSEDIHFHNTQLFFNPPNPERTPYWHRDMQYSPIPDQTQQQAQSEMLSLHVRIPLLPETSIELIPGSHRTWDTVLQRQVRFEQNGHSSSDALPEAQLVALKPGDLLIFNAQMLHRGLYHNDAERLGLDLCVGGYHQLTAAYLDPQVLPSDAELAQINHKEWFTRAKQVVQKRPD